jgi:TrmH family RNA methyltransferase
MKNIFDKLSIVLVGTTHPGNIGAVARAMKTMSQKNLRLVNPLHFPSAEASARAAGADDILAKCKQFSTLEEAIKDCDLVIGTSARIRGIPWPMILPRECAKKIFEETNSSVAIVFGRESSGLSNNELQLCNMVLKIPTNSEFNSLNLAAAVQIICYEIYLVASDINADEYKKDNLAFISQEKMEKFYTHLEECFIQVGFHDISNPKKLMHRIRRLFNRTQLYESEWKILRGFISKIQEKTKNNHN